MTIEVPVGSSLVALVDDVDAEAVLAAGPWHPYRRPHTTYAIAHTRKESGQRTTVQMHVLILGIRTGIDHVDRDGLNNRRANLRPATRSQNGANRRVPSNNTSGYRGVAWHRRNSRWIASIQVDKRTRHLGYFGSPEEAARAYNVAAVQYFGEFAVLNELPP